VELVDRDSIELRITAAGAKGSKLRAGKGINLPDAVLDIDLLGTHSEEALQFAAECANIVGLSFVSRARDVKRVHAYLDQHARPEVGMILKIETRRAFEHLPGLLLAALGGERPAGVMIARGDLAVECGYERLAEVQEEILWLCQAAHVPVIWATQVLDQLAKTGRPSRAEITDAAMGVQAECVMLNKGPRIVEAISVLDDILRRMEQHQRKKRSQLPRLGVSDYVHSLSEE
jgi:pyruvate kinase